ncbi:MAG: MFS transporter [Gammaproteobacteria bacterium]|nr:MFS transporter [Gammaproteobacteria bacterium]
MNQKPSETPKRGGFLSNLAFNIIIPVVILSKFSGAEDLGPAWSIVVALSFPICYGLWDLKQSGKVNAFSILGIVSVFLTGGMSLLELDPKYIAIKEAAVPAIIGIAVLITQKTKYPIIKVFILNEQIIKIEKLYAILSEKKATERFEKILARSSYIVAGSFALSSVLNYVLAKVILVSPPGTTAFSEELGKMTALSYPVIALPSMTVMMIAIWYLFSQIGKLTGESIENFIVGAEPEQSQDSA